MNRQEVIDLMKGSKSESEWNANCDKVKREFGGYPDFWYEAIIQPGVAKETLEKFGGSADIKATVYKLTPLPNIYGRPTSMPSIENGQRIIGIYDQGLGEKKMVCNSLSDMQSLYDKYSKGFALTLRWVIEDVHEVVVPVP